jgi:hypothetical protein
MGFGEIVWITKLEEDCLIDGVRFAFTDLAWES